MRWVLLIGAVLFAGAFAAVAALTAPGREVAARPGRSEDAALSTPPGPELRPAVAPGSSLAAPEAPRPAIGPAPASAPSRSGHEEGEVDGRGNADPMEALDLAARRRALEPLRPEVRDGLRQLSGRIAHCDLGGASVFVTLETLDGGVRVTAVRLEASPAPDRGPGDPPGDVPEPIVHCVRGALERNVVGAPSARPGRSFELALAPNALDVP